MKLIRFGERGEERPGIELPSGERRDLSAFGEDFDENFFGSGGVERLGRWLASHLASTPVVDPTIRLGVPLLRPSKIICVGLNYKDHATETKSQLPKEPVLFLKATSAITGPNDDVILPRSSEKTDWEVELGVVIGNKASYVEERDAFTHIAGYILHGDYSERAFQLERSGQWTKGKSCDTFAPLGPYVVTADEVPDPHALRLWLTVNGVTRQDSSTSEMAFSVPFLVSYISQFMTLLPGDIISTGTPAGVGHGMNPPMYLRAGDIVEQGIELLGTSKQQIRASL